MIENELEKKYLNEAKTYLNESLSKLFKMIKYEGDQVKFHSDNYPILIKPFKDLQFDYLSEMINLFISNTSSRLRNSEHWDLVKQFSEHSFENYLAFSKSFLISMSEQQTKKIKLFLNDVMAFKQSLKTKFNLDNLNDLGDITDQ